ncbi:MAG TPA: site-2 protease family protein [Halobacteriales archaeon]|nr:site-2 protease family protein [Halobacteriales archaeon]
MRKFRIGSLFGIPIQLDLTFLIVLPLFAWLIGSQIEGLAETLTMLWGVSFDVGMLTAGSMPWIIGIVAALGLFVGVVLHELGHSLVAMRYGFEIDSITLWIFGGIAQFTEMPEDWKQELTVAIAGPAVSVVLGAGLYAVFVALPEQFGATRFVVGYLALLNVVLAAFNLLPGFPMDGGRVLRALLNTQMGYAQATKRAAEVGKVFALLLGLVGLLGGNLILIGIAFFIYIGASGEAQQTVMKAAFEGVTVRDVMTPAADVSTVPPDETIEAFVDRMFRERHTGYPVVEHGEIVGLVTLEDAQSVRPVEREAFTVDEVMTRELAGIDASADAMTAITEMQKNGVGRLIVRERGEFVGLVTRTDLVTAFNIIQSSGSLGGTERAQRGALTPEVEPEDLR